MEKYSKELGAKDLKKGKIMPSVAASMLSLLIMEQTGVAAVGDTALNSPSASTVASQGKSQEQGFFSRNMGRLMAGAAFLTSAGVYWMKNRGSERKKELMEMLREELIVMLPGAWKKFWDADADFGRAAEDFLIEAADADPVYKAVDRAFGGPAWRAYWKIDTWKAPNGDAYKLVEKKPTEYFRNLLKVLKEQTEHYQSLLKISKEQTA